MIKIELVAVHDLIDSNREEVQELVDHRLAFQSFSILSGEFVVLYLVCIERREGVVVDERNEVAEGRKGYLVIIFD